MVFPFFDTGGDSLVIAVNFFCIILFSMGGAMVTINFLTDYLAARAANLVPRDDTQRYFESLYEGSGTLDDRATLRDVFGVLLLSGLFILLGIYAVPGIFLLVILYLVIRASEIDDDEWYDPSADDLYYDPFDDDDDIFDDHELDDDWLDIDDLMAELRDIDEDFSDPRNEDLADAVLDDIDDDTFWSSLGDDPLDLLDDKNQ